MGTEIKKCAVISGAPEEDLSYYHKFLQDRYIICADSGYEKCAALGITPDLIIGDFDSSPRPHIECEIIDLKIRKNDTDTFHCVKEAIDRGCSSIVILGGIGDRVDHTYSNILSVVYCYDSNIECELINKKNRLFVAGSDITLSRGKYEYFSLFALFQKCTVSIKGAQYELDAYELAPDCQLTQSNAFKDDQVKISVKNGKIILILCND